MLTRKENEWGNKKQRNQDRQPTLQALGYVTDWIGRHRGRETNEKAKPLTTAYQLVLCLSPTFREMQHEICSHIQ